MESGRAVIECDTSKLCALGCGSTSHSQNAALTAICRIVHTPTTWMHKQIGGDIIKVTQSIFIVRKHLSDQPKTIRKAATEKWGTFAGSLYLPK